MFFLVLLPLRNSFSELKEAGFLTILQIPMYVICMEFGDPTVPPEYRTIVLLMSQSCSRPFRWSDFGHYISGIWYCTYRKLIFLSFTRRRHQVPYALLGG